MERYYLVLKYSKKGPKGDYPEPFKGRYAWREWAEFPTEEEAANFCNTHSGTFKYTTIYKEIGK